MKFVDDLREKPAVKKAEKFFPAVAFLGGFGWDSITLGQMVQSSDLVFLLAYYLGALILVVLLSAHLEHPEGWTKDRLKAAAAAQAKSAAQAKPVSAPSPLKPSVKPASATPASTTPASACAIP